MKRLVLLVLSIFILSLFVTGCSSSNVNTVRGKYVYDTTHRLSNESALSIGTRLWQIDSKTNYEIVVYLPEAKIDENACMNWFNTNGVGKKDKNNGAVLFIFPDNTWFISIGSGNDAVSVPYSKTFGDKILTSDNLKSDLSLTIIRYVEALRTQIETSVSQTVSESWWDTFKPIVPLALIWAVVLALVLLLIQQFDGFQMHDLILPIIAIGLIGSFIGVSALINSTDVTHFTDYGIVTNTQKSTHDWVEMRRITTGKTSVTVPVHHTDYINTITALDYDIKVLSFTNKTTDNQGAWDINKDDFLRMVVTIKDNQVNSASEFNANSGGTSIGDGVGSITK